MAKASRRSRKLSLLPETVSQIRRGRASPNNKSANNTKSTRCRPQLSNGFVDLVKRNALPKAVISDARLACILLGVGVTRRIGVQQKAVDEVGRTNEPKTPAESSLSEALSLFEAKIRKETELDSQMAMIRLEPKMKREESEYIRRE